MPALDRFLSLSLSGCRYSDGYDYKTYVIGVVNSGFSGLIWAPEMRHATCTSNHTAAEHADFARRSQLMFLSPQAQYNAVSTRNSHCTVTLAEF